MDDSAPEYDVAILGAGAAGLMAAIRAAERGRRVLLVEKNRRPGVKILISGGTRCNLTNARGLRTLRSVSGPIDPAYDSREARGSRSIAAAFGENSELAFPVGALPSLHAAWPFAALLFFWDRAPGARPVLVAYNVAMAGTVLCFESARQRPPRTGAPTPSYSRESGAETHEQEGGA